MITSTTTERIAIVIPAYNEARIIREVIARTRQSVPEATIIVVDDCSRDDTSQLARDSGAVVLSLPVNLGDGGARQAGFKYALRHGFDWVVQLDGDGQHPPEDIARLLGPLRSGDADLVIGSRFLDQAGYRVPPVRRVGMVLFAFFASLFSRHKITDPTSGYRACSRAVLRFFCSPAYPQKYPDADLLVATGRAGFSIREIPISMAAGVTGTLHHGWRPLYYIYKVSLSLFAAVMHRESADSVRR